MQGHELCRDIRAESAQYCCRAIRWTVGFGDMIKTGPFVFIALSQLWENSIYNSVDPSLLHQGAKT
jgi:hypothetical protein